jgi:signal transduction histidine kinase
VSLRQKLLLPLVLIALLIGGYVYGVWMPRSLVKAELTHVALVERHLESVVEGLIPLLLSRQLDTVHENLAALLRSNPDWTELILTDSRGRQLFPLATQALSGRDGREIRELQKRIHYFGSDLGVLRVHIDIAPTLAYDRRQHIELTMLWLGVLTVVMLTVVATLELAVRRPVRRLAEAARGLAQQDFSQPLPPVSHDEVGALVESFASMRDELHSKRDALMTEIEERRQAQEALQRLNETLERRVQEEVAKNRDKDHMIIQQSRLAAMGEMVHNIAHQWRQPLNSLGLLLSNLRDDARFGSMTPESLDRDVSTARRLIEKMSTTIDDFRDFFRPDREATDFDVATAIWDALSVVDAAMRHNRILVSTDLDERVMVSGFPSQFSQAVLNLLVNAKEVIVNRKVERGQIHVSLSAEGEYATVTVEDNGGGIPDEVLPKMFDPYFTTKDEGSGIGLYMVKMIVEKNMGGQVEAVNGRQGAKLVMRIPIGK